MCSLIGFSDGSSVAYGCTLYLRWYDKDESIIDVKFVGAKGKVNPIKGTTVPRSEIGGAFTLSRLADSAETAFSKTEINDVIKEKILITDSTTVLSWIKSAASKYKSFVIQELHPVSVWEYLPSAKNKSADLISKECLHKDLDLIIRGPEVLFTPRSTWPKLPLVEEKTERDSEKIPNIMINTARPDDSVINVEKSKSWKKLLRITAYILRFNLRYRNRNYLYTCGGEIINATREETEKAEKYWVLQAQRELCKDLSANQTKKLVPFKDEEGIIRIYGRMINSDLFDESRKHPILLPKHHKISMLITKQTHNDLYHPGVMRVVSEIRKKYWVIGVRTLAKKIGKK